MLKWCAYCQKFNGEAPPFNDFSVSHGICKKCLARHSELPSKIPNQIHQISRFFVNIWESARKGKPLSPEFIIEEGKKLGISQTDLFMGILQPLLYLIGQGFEKGEIDIKTEHRFSAVVNQIIAQCDKEEREELVTREPNVEALLVEARGNTHSIGLHFLKLYLVDFGICAKHVLPGPSPESINKMIEQDNPLLVGVSLALSKQIPFVNELVKNLNHEIPVFVGGSLFKTDNEKNKLHLLTPKVNQAEPAELLEIIQKLKERNAA